MTEEWRPVEVSGQRWPYDVSSAGRVRRAEPGVNTYVGRILRLPKNGDGYPQVMLYGTGAKKVIHVHSLVAEAFLGPRPENRVVNHVDHDRTNNNLDNLEYVTYSENVPNGYLFPEQVLELRGELDGLMAKYNVNPCTLQDIASRRTWRWLNEN